MNLKCYFQYDDGRFCKNWAMRGTRFCNNHQPPEAAGDPAVVDHVTVGLPPVQLKGPSDLLQLVGDALNGLRTGSFSPGRAYAASCLGKLWLELFQKIKSDSETEAFMRKWKAKFPNPLDEPESPPGPAPDPEPPPPANALVPPPPPPHDPWAAGRAAGPAPASPAKANDPADFPDLEQVQARLIKLLGFKPEDLSNHEAEPQHAAASSRSIPNGSSDSHRKARDPAA